MFFALPVRRASEAQEAIGRQWRGWPGLSVRVSEPPDNPGTLCRTLLRCLAGPPDDHDDRLGGGWARGRHAFCLPRGVTGATATLSNRSDSDAFFLQERQRRFYTGATATL